MAGSGNLRLDGHCFGNVATLPSGGTLRILDKAVFKDGNFYGKGAITYSASTFPGMFKAGAGSALMSVASDGSANLAGICVNVDGCSNTQYEPSIWNDVTQGYNNCYNYGTDQHSSTFQYAQPGFKAYVGSTIPPDYYDYDSVQVAVIRARSLRDGLTWVGWSFPGNTYDCGSGHLVFMAVDVGWDYHWWRLDQKDGAWSHKPGGTPATNLDDDGLPILNPLLANRGGYTDPGGFYCLCGSQVGVLGWGDF